MYYEINVSRKGQHVFATAPRSLNDFATAARVYAVIAQAFGDGFEVSVSRVQTSGEEITSQVTKWLVEQES